MGILTWILLGVIVLVAIGLGVGVFFSGLVTGIQKVGENPAVQNASQETQEFLNDTVDLAPSSVVISVTTDRSVYSAGEPVQIIVSNNGSDTLRFPNSALGLEVRNKDNGQSYSLLSAQVLTDLEPGESNTLTWQDENAPPGKYVARVRTVGGQSSETSFELE